MENGLNKILESEVLSEETRTALSEAWKAKLAEAQEKVRGEVEAQVKEELSARFNQDRLNLAEAADKMLTQAVKEHAEKTFAATEALKEERQKLTQAIKESRVEYKNKIAEHSKMLESFVLSQLKTKIAALSEGHKSMEAQSFALAKKTFEAKKEIQANLKEHLIKFQGLVHEKLKEHVSLLNKERAELVEAKAQTKQSLTESTNKMTVDTAKRINALENFVVSQLKKELVEFKTDRDALHEMKARMVVESKAKLEETKKQFISRAANLVETTVNKQLRHEMTTLKEDIRSARENIFGRRLFEAFQAEFMTSYLQEGSQVKELSNKLDEAKRQLEEATNKIGQQNALMEQAKRRMAVSEERASRVKTLNDLLRPLSKDKREFMESLLETVKTQNLKESFQKYLPAVLNETVATPSKSRQALSETAVVSEKNKTVTVTGDRQTTRLAESARADDGQSQAAEIIELRRLAGITEK